MKSIIDTFNDCPLNDYDDMDTIVSKSKEFIKDSFKTPRKDPGATSTQNIMSEKRKSKPIVIYSIDTENKGSTVKTSAVKDPLTPKVKTSAAKKKSKITKAPKITVPITTSTTTSTKTKPNKKTTNHSDDFVDDNDYDQNGSYSDYDQSASDIVKVIHKPSTVVSSLVKEKALTVQNPPSSGIQAEDLFGFLKETHMISMEHSHKEKIALISFRDRRERSRSRDRDRRRERSRSRDSSVGSTDIKK
jgi:hypothetical protein